MAAYIRLTNFIEHMKFKPTVPAATVLMTILAITIVPRLHQSYTIWYNLGPAGAIPRNILGWLVQGLVNPLAYSDPLSLSLFRQASIVKLYGANGQRSFLPGYKLPYRNGSRPHVPAGFVVVPQRQTAQKGSPEMICQMEAYMRFLAQANPQLLKIESSRLEGVGNPALFLADGLSNPLVGGNMRGELVHRHGEGSSHMVLSLADAEEAVKKGWSQRFRLSNVILVPATYVMVYAPRNEEELAIWKSLVLASARFILANESTELMDEGVKSNKE